MENKIQLFDSDDNKIGETFFRRAKQLVKQQRASWVGDDQKAIKFLPDMENLGVNVNDDADDIPSAGVDEGWLLSVAEKRIKARKLFRMHTILFLPGLFLAFFAASGIGDVLFTPDGAVLFLGFAWGSWATAYFIHAFFYFQLRLYKNNGSERRKRELAAEIATIKSEL